VSLLRDRCGELAGNSAAGRTTVKAATVKAATVEATTWFEAVTVRSMEILKAVRTMAPVTVIEER
jgi:hypothetical protein